MISKDFLKDSDGTYNVFINIELNDFSDLRKNTICNVSLTNTKDKKSLTSYKQESIEVKGDMTTIEEKIRKAFENANYDEWVQLETSIPGVFLVKPARKSVKGLILMINPVDESGNPIKRKGLYLNSYGTLKKFKELINDNDKRISELFKAVDNLKRDGKIIDL